MHIFILSRVFKAKARSDDVKEEEAIHYVDGPQEDKEAENRAVPEVQQVIKIEEVKPEVINGEFRIRLPDADPTEHGFPEFTNICKIFLTNM
jgi:hypothetical protein